MKSLLVPEDIIRSVKDEKNRTLPGRDYSTISNEKMFLSRGNAAYLAKHMFLKHSFNGGQTQQDIFYKAVPRLMMIWSIKENLDDFEGHNNYHWVLTLDYINNKFVKDHKPYWHVQGAETNVFKAKALTGSINEFDGRDIHIKKYDEMTAADYQNLDVWEEQSTYLNNNAPYRNKNKIPFYQQTMRTRLLDRENEGLRSNSWARASLEVPIRGYGGQPHIIATTGREKDLEWTNF